MITAQAEIEIDCPIEEVFDFLADARNELRWLPGAAGVEKVSDGPVRLGARFRGEYARIGTVTLDIVAFERPARVTFHGRARSMEFDDAIALEATPEGTILHAAMEAHPGVLMKLLTPAVRGVMRRQFAANWLELKAALERGMGAASAPARART
jgi:carbon monoxide dehydrogenase subunit G